MQPHDSTSTQKSKLHNEIHICGRVATEPSRSGKGPFKFRIGHGGGGKRKDGSPWPVQWFSVACWSETAMEGVVKGARVELFGKLRDSTYTTQDGTVKYGTEIVADAIVTETKETAQPPLTPNQTARTDGAAAARAILKPVEKLDSQPGNIHGLEVSDADIPF